MKSKLIPTPPAPPVEQPLTFPCLIEEKWYGNVSLILLAVSQNGGVLLFNGSGNQAGNYYADRTTWADWLKAASDYSNHIARRVIPAGEAVTIQFNA